MPYTWAWVVVIIAALVGGLGLYFATRSLPLFWIRRLLRWLLPVLLIVPAPVPGHHPSYAPAFIVAAFEGLFQSEGAPEQALRILLAALALVCLAVAGTYFTARRKAAGEAPVDPEIGETR